MQKWNVKFIDDKTGVCYYSGFVRTNNGHEAVSLVLYNNEQISLAISRLMEDRFDVYLSIRIERVGKEYPLSEVIL